MSGSNTDSDETTVLVGYPSGQSLAFKASAIHPFDVKDGDLHVFNTKGYAIAIFASGYWSAAVSQTETVVAGKET